ncbi:MAG: hypothetical protein P1V19_11070 [Gimesia sp.]|nr:hypothetical protein [Gimesia sp.]
MKSSPVSRRNFLAGTSLGLLGAAGVPLQSAESKQYEPSSIDTRANRVSLVDARWISHSNFLTRQLAQPQRVSAEPVITPAGAAGTILPADDGGFVMWYSTTHSVPVKGGKTHQSWIHYATSKDGITFQKPELGIHQGNVIIKGNQSGADGKPLTGIRGCSGFSVLDAKHQKVPHARARYTALYRSWIPNRPGGLSLAHSEDGLRWTEYPENAVRVGASDTFNNFFYDERIKKYVAYVRPRLHAGGSHVNRLVARIVSDDMIHWNDERVVLDTDDQDAPAVGTINEATKPNGTRYPRGRDKQFYGLTAAPYGDLYLGLASLYDVEPGTMSIELVHSYDGIDWRREATRGALISPGDKESWDSAIIYYPLMGNPVEVGDNWLIYYHGTNFDHHMRNRSRKELGEYRAMGAVQLKRDRLIGYQAGKTRGELLTQPFKWEGKELFLNASAEGGQAQVVVCNSNGSTLKGFQLSKSVPIHQEGVRLPVSFNEGASLATLKGRDIRLRIYLQNATVFGWEVA